VKDYSKLSDEELKRLAGVSDEPKTYTPARLASAKKLGISKEQLAQIDNPGGQGSIESMSDDELMRIAGVSPEKKGGSSVAKSAAGGLTQGATFGYTPQIVGGLASIVDKLMPPVIDPLTGKRIPRADYTSARDATSKELNKLRDENPATYMAGNIVGGLAVPIPGASVKTIGGAAKRGALTGVLANPGETEGEISPVQPVERGMQAALGLGLGAAGAKAAQSIGRAARGARAAEELVRPGTPQKLQGELEDAAGKLQERYISPRIKAAREALKQKQVQVNPRILEGADEQGLMAALQKRTPIGRARADVAKRNTAIARENARISESGYGTQRNLLPDPIISNPADELATLDGATLDRVRRILDRRAGFKQRSALASPQVAKSAEETANAAHSLREIRNRAAPELQDSFGEQSYALGLRKELLDRSKSPVEALAVKPGSTPAGKLADIDSFAGTNLVGRGQDLSRGQYFLGRNEEMPASREGWIGFLSRNALRSGAQYGARPLDAILEGPLKDKALSEAFIRSLVEQIARGK
jgi:hypothetical protein